MHSLKRILGLLLPYSGVVFFLILYASLVLAETHTVDEIAGSKFVIANGGQVKTIALIEGFSTSQIIHKIQQK